MSEKTVAAASNLIRFALRFTQTLHFLDLTLLMRHMIRIFYNCSVQ